MYKNILFDLGGVLIEFNPRLFLLERFANEELENKLYDISFGSDTWLQLDQGVITRRDANKIMLEKAIAMGKKFEMNTIINDWQDTLRTKEDTSKLLKLLRFNNYSLYYASNMAPDTLELIKKRHFWPFFRGGVASCDIKINKPDERFFKYLLIKYNLNINETIFIDDTLENVFAARNLGLCAIHFTDCTKLISELVELGVNLKIANK